jgi:hypothetical protein
LSIEFQMHKFIKYLVALPVLLGYFSVNAQYDSSLGNWEVFILKGNINKKFSFNGEFNIRANDFHSTYNYCEYKLGFGYSIKKNLIIGAGAGGYNTSFTGSFLTAPPSLKEFRLWFDVVFKHSFSRLYFEHRVRAERRYTDFGDRNRLRYRLGLNVPISKPGMTNNTIYFASSDEFFVGQGHPAYEKNKLFIGVGYKLNDRLNFQLGNLNQNDYKGSYILCKNYLQLTLVYNLPGKVNSKQ